MTNEISNSKLNAGSPTGDVKIPNVANQFGVSVISLFDFQKAFKFKF
ncbi:DUF4411 family protein [Tetragenococcus halophilus]|nr:DUF4411 family protein [Tetragenococcus halophilus]